MTETTNSTGYLVYGQRPRRHGFSPSGFEHAVYSLKTMIREAAWLSRIPVVSSVAPLDSFHNLYCPVHTPWSKYLALDDIRIALQSAEGSRTLQLAAITAKELETLNIPTSHTLELSGRRAITARENTRFRTIYRSLSTNQWWDEACGYDTDAWVHEFPPPADMTDPEQAIQVIIKSPTILKALATSVIGKLPKDYWAIHIRRRDKLSDGPAQKKATRITALLEKFNQFGVAPGDTLYVMTDECRKNYLAPLRRKYHILDYSAFAELSTLISLPGTIDNYLLFQVEKEIMAGAARRIHAVPQDNAGPSDYYLLSSPWKSFKQYPVHTSRLLKRVLLLREVFSMKVWRTMSWYPWSRLLVKALGKSLQALIWFLYFSTLNLAKSR